MNGKDGILAVVKPKTKFSLVATDLDGTFLGENPEGSKKPNMPTKDNVEVFRKLDADGVPLAMISGRSYATTSVMMDYCALDQYVISCHGAIIFGPKGGGADRAIVKSWPVTADLQEAAAAAAVATDTLVMMYTADGIVSAGRVDDNLTFPNLRGEPIGSWWARVGEFPIQSEGHPAFEALAPELKDLVKSSPLFPNSRHFEAWEDLLAHVRAAELNVYKVLLVARPARIPDVLAKARDQIPPELGNVMGPFESWVEIIHPDVNKAVAVHHLADTIGSSLAECVTFGDGLNDVEMLRQAGLGVAMANAVPEAREAAAYVSTFSNEESAVAHELGRLVVSGLL
mmetsp:Transcript_20960/g.54534  ORF Transcript_20960/g.54534 Transcript_20960/m.54534 type:complete len:342 (-) Transcript_20960:115-1140(-)